MKQKRSFPPVLAIVGAALGIALFSLVPVLSLWAGDRAAIHQPHARTAQAGTLSITCDDIYITRMLKKQALADPRTYSKPAGYADAMQYIGDGEWNGCTLRGLLDEAHSAGLLPDAWYACLSEAIGDWNYAAVDTLGFANYIAYSVRDTDKGVYAVGFTVEVQSKKIVGIFAGLTLAEAPPDTDCAALLPGYVSYLDAEQVNDWMIPAGGQKTANTLYSANAELLLTAQTGTYTAWPQYTLVGESTQQYDRCFFSLSARHAEPPDMQRRQAYELSFAGVPDTPMAAGTLRVLEWANASPAFSEQGDACYELITANIEVEENGEENRRTLLLKTDYTSGMQAPLCSVQGCTHDSASCPAWGDGSRAAAVGDAVLILSEAGAFTDECARIDRVDRAGTSRTRLYTFPPEWEVSGDSCAFTDGQAIYLIVFDAQRWESAAVRICLANGEATPFTLPDFFDWYQKSVTAVGSTLYFLFEEQNIPLKSLPLAASMENIVGVPENAVRCVAYDLATGLRREVDLTPLWKAVEAWRGEASAMADGKVYCIREEPAKDGEAESILWQYDLLTGEIVSLCGITHSRGAYRSMEYLPDAAGQHACLRVVLARNIYITDVEACWYYDLQSGALLEMPLSYIRPYDALPRRCTADGRWLAVTETQQNTWEIRRRYVLMSDEQIESGTNEGQETEIWQTAPALG